MRVLATDRNRKHLDLLRNSGLSLITEDFPTADLSDSYALFENDIVPNAKDDDLTLIDPFAEFPRYRAVIPQMAIMARHAAILLFALNRDVGNRVDRRFDKLLEEYLPGAWHRLHRTGGVEIPSGGCPGCPLVELWRRPVEAISRVH